jgi:hypothetical protein
MLTLVLIGLGIAILLAAVVLGVIFVRAAFWGEQDQANEVNDELTWRPSFLRGEALRNWAARVAETTAFRRLQGKLTGRTALQLAAEIEQGALHAMLPLARQAEIESVVACPDAGQGTIGVTPVEVLAIVAALRKKRSREEQKRVHALAAENARTIASRGSNPTEQRPLACPLQGTYNVCRTFGERPLQCRPLHAVAVARTMGSRRASHVGTDDGSSDHHGYEDTVAEGIALGLSRALQSASLDGNTYEFNSALATALEIPDAAERWARGEDVFASCPRVDRSTNETLVSDESFRGAFI